MRRRVAFVRTRRLFMFRKKLNYQQLLLEIIFFFSLNTYSFYRDRIELLLVRDVYITDG